MTCIELQESLAEVEDGSTAAQKAHLRTCLACSALVKDLNLIVTAAAGLQDADEPSPRVWNSIEIALRQEGLIRPQRSPGSFGHSLLAGWGVRWLAPAAALLLFAAGLFVRERIRSSEAQPEAKVIAPVPSQTGMIDGMNDDDLMQEVSLSAPAMKTQYEENLKRVNDSIRDAQNLVDETPNDEDARRSLLDAYQQKSMLFELAMDRSLP